MSIRSYDKVIRYGHLANMIYESEDGFRQFLVKYYSNLKLIQWISCHQTDTQCAIVIDDDTLLVVFRGVANEKGLSEFLNDSELTTHISMEKRFTAKKDVFYAHTGFLNAYDSIQSLVNSAVNFLGIQKVVTVGHSLGGAISQICALDIATSFDHTTVRNYTYGTPEIGNHQYCKVLIKNVRTLRIYHRLDPIPCILPPFFGYIHCGHSLRLGKKSWFSFKWIKYHFMDNYIKLLLSEKVKFFG